MKKVGHFLRVFFGVIFAIATVVYIVVAITEPQVRVPMIVVAIIAGALAVLLLKRKKPKAADQPTAPLPVKVTTTLVPDVPEETLRDMRKYYSAMQAQSSAQVMADSFKLAQQTMNIDTFMSRLSLAQQHALTILQAEKAGVKGIKQLRLTQACEGVLEASPEVKVNFLERTYIHETNAALLLKTPAGQRRRMQAYIDMLQEHEAYFMDVEDAYNDVIEKTRTLMP